MRPPVVALFVLLALPVQLAIAHAAVAQRPAAVRVAADNDAFTFWRAPWDRTDRDYTSGVFGALEFEGPSAIARVPRRLALGCERGCTTSHVVTLGQAIYTGDRGDADGPAVRPVASGRPNAGWLYIEASQRDSTDAAVQSVSIAAGVVGPEALGETMQRLFHAIGPEFQRSVDWSRQLPFEPGFVARLARTTRLRSFDAPGGWSGALTAHTGAAVGTILTSVTAGGGAGAGIRVGGADAGPLWPHLDLRADLRAHLVARDEFLDGTFFRESDRATRIPFYDEERLTASFRWPRFTVAYRVTRAGLQYRGQPGPSAWGSLAVEWRPAR